MTGNDTDGSERGPEQSPARKATAFRKRGPRLVGAMMLGVAIVVAVASAWLFHGAEGADARLIVQEGGPSGEPLDGREIHSKAEVLIETDGEIDSVAYRLVDSEGRVLFAKTAWSPPFTLAVAGTPDVDPLNAATLAPGRYLLTATVGFTGGAQTEASAAFTIASSAAARTETVEDPEPADADDGSTEPEVEPRAPSDSGRPGPDSTGPRVPDSELEPSGSLVVTEDGAIVEGLDIAGTLVIEANDVVVRDTRVRSSARYPVRAMPGTTGTVIEHVEIDGQYSLDTNGCIVGPMITVRRSELHRCTDGAKVGPGSVYEGNWIHDPTRDSRGSDAHHIDGLQSTGGNGIVIRGNHIDVVTEDGHLSNAAIILKSDSGAITDCLIEGNWLNGGNYTIFLREGQHGPPSGCAVRDNRFGRDFQYGLFSIDGDVERSGNVWADGSGPVQD